MSERIAEWPETTSIDEARLDTKLEFLDELFALIEDYKDVVDFSFNLSMDVDDFDLEAVISC